MSATDFSMGRNSEMVMMRSPEVMLSWGNLEDAVIYFDCVTKEKQY